MSGATATSVPGVSGASATSVPLPGPPRRSARTGRAVRRLGSRAVRDSVVLRLVAFTALATFAAIHWVGLLGDPPVGRVAIAVAAQVAAAATIATIAAARIPRPVAWALALSAGGLCLGVGAMAVGLPARLLAPGHWGELADGLNRGLSGLGSVHFPYGGGGWSRLAILLGLPPLLGLAAALAFWPTRRGGARPRTLALLVLVATYGIAVTVSPPGAPLLSGLALLLLVAAWLWLPSRDPRDALVGGALVLAAGALALPLAARFDGDEAWLDYRDWQWAWYAAGGGESFNWDQSYGPIDWPRTGKALLEVRSDAPHYWRTAVLDQFDGIRWLRSEQGANGNLELPRRTSGSQFTPQTVPLNPRWMDEITFTVRDLRSDLVVGAGAVLSVDGLGGVAPAPGGLTPAAGVPLSEGDSYTVRAYVPDPTADEMRSAGTRYPSALASYAALDIPTSRNAHRRKPGPPQRSSYASQVTTRQLAVPLRGSAPQAQRAAARALSASAYGGVYRLARRLTDDAPTPYDAVQSVQDYLQGNYDYRENPPDHNYPLRAFLFDDRFGYCQQFSGAMALMLRMVGIPTRVAGGFSPGTPSRKDDGAYVVRDLDAHSWVEVYFNGIGWVPFDPTPPAAPAQSQTNGLGLFANAPSVGKALLKEAGHSLDARRPRPVVASSSGDSLSLWLLPPLVLLLAVGGAAAALGVRALRSRALSPAAATEARLRELEAALRRLRAWTPGGTTLVVLERRLGFLAGPAAAAYAARLRAARYSPRDPGPPTAAERRALRRALSAGLGLLSRLRGFLAIPPGGPAAR